MPLLKRSDDAEIWWEATGEGPAIVLCNTFNLASLDGLIELLAKQRKVISYHPRGVGKSSPVGPYDLETGQADLEAVLEETGPAAATLALGDGACRALRVAVARPDLIDKVVITSTGLGRTSSAGFSGSAEVLSALMSLMRRDYRTGLRSMVSGSQVEGEEADKERVEQLAALIPQDAAVGYLDAWIADDAMDQARALGPRLAILAYGGNAWFPLESFEDMSLNLPDAEYEEVEDGPMGRPDRSAELLLRLTG